MDEQQMQTTLEAEIVAWLETERPGRYTSYQMICRKWCLHRYLKQAVVSLVSSGQIRKTKSGYKSNHKEVTQ